MKRTVIALLLAGTLALLAACGGSTAPIAGRSTGPAVPTPTAVGGCQQVVMQAGAPGAGYFEPSTCTIKAGAMITFSNQSTVVMEVFLGANQKFQANPNGPPALNTPNGVTVYPNDAYSATFGDAGTFAVTATCSQPMPNMNMTVTVTGS